MTLARANLIELRAAREAGTLIDAEVAAREAFAASRILRDRVLNVTSRVAPELAAEQDVQKVATRLDQELRQALHAAADQLTAMAG